MKTQRFESRDSSPRYDPFNHTGEDIDPNLIAVPPGDPYTLIAPGIRIKEGDIKRTVGDGNRWMPIEEHEEGHKSPTKGVAYARATAPEGYVLMSGTDRVSPSCLIWTSGTGDWRRAAEHGLEEETTVSNLASLYRKERNQLFFAAKPKPGKENHRFAELPSRHRELFPGEKLRMQDRMIHEGSTEWILVGMLSLGQPVVSPNILNGHVRFCRLIHPNHQHCTSTR